MGAPVIDFATYRAASDGERVQMRAGFQQNCGLLSTTTDQEPHEKIAALARETSALAASLANGAISPRTAAAVADMMAKEMRGCVGTVIDVLDALALEKDKRRKWKKRAKRR